MRRLLLVYTLLLVSGVLPRPAHAVTLDEAASALQRNRRVYDFARVLSTGEVSRLQQRLAEMEQAGLAEGAVILLDRLEGGTVEEYALALGERWKVGRKDVDNGFVLLVSIGDRKWWLEVGKDLQG